MAFKIFLNQVLRRKNFHGSKHVRSKYKFSKGIQVFNDFWKSKLRWQDPNFGVLQASHVISATVYINLALQSKVRTVSNYQITTNLNTNLSLLKELFGINRSIPNDVQEMKKAVSNAKFKINKIAEI